MYFYFDVRSVWILLFLLITFELSNGQHNNLTGFELHPQDGFFNNLLHPDWGAIDGQLLRKSPVAYSDGVYQPSGQDRPNPFRISEAAHHGPAGLSSMRNRTAFMVYFGQQVVEEILDAQRPGCPREFFNVPVDPEVKIPDFDPEDKGNIEMPFLRSRYDQRTGFSPNNPRQQLNEITPFIDGTLFYGPGKAWTDAIRELSEEHRGRLKVLDETKPLTESFPALNDIRLPFANPPPPREHELKPVARFWRIGNPRGNENPFLLAFGVLFFRWHNYFADKFAAANPDLNDEEVFNIARKWTIATHQKIVLYDWLPAWLSVDESGNTFDIPKYVKYDPNIHPGVTHEFSTAAMRFGHTLVTPGTYVRDANCQFTTLSINIQGQPDKAHAVRLCNAYWNSQEFLTSSPESFDNMLMGLATTLAEREDHVVVPDLREHLFGPLEFSRRDLVALNIQRARDHGLPSYNDVRHAFGLKRLKSWEAINNVTFDVNDPYYSEYPNGYMFESIQNLKALYGNTDAPDNLDLFSGGLLETTPDGPGELFQEILLEQFLRIRNADRFWFENIDNGLFSEDEIAEIMNIKIEDVILKTTNIKSGDINTNPFLFKSGDKCPQPAQLKADSGQTFNDSDEVTIENCTTILHYDYFSGSEYSFALSFAGLGLFVPGTIGVMILMAKLKQRKIQKARRRNAPRKKDEDPNTYLAVEWIGFTDGERNIKIKFDEERKKLHVSDRGRKPLRMIDLRHTDRIHFRLSNDRGETLMSVRVPGEIDLVLRFAHETWRREFIAALEAFCQKVKVRRENHEMKESMILKDATTKEMRKKVLDNFIRVVCLQAFKKSAPDIDMKNLDSKTANEVSNIQLTRTEFADALGLKPTSMFVRNMFIMVDKDKSGFVSFHEFMEIFMILARGGADEKAAMMFNMYDIRGRGELTPEQFKKMIKSMLDLSDSSLDTSDIDTLVQTLYTQAGLRVGQNMTLAGFKKIFASDEYEKTLEKATLQLQGAKEKWQDRKSVDMQFSVRRKTFIQSFGGDDDDINAPATRPLNRSKSKIVFNAKPTSLPKTGIRMYLYELTKFVENYKRQIFWITLYIFISIGIFLERALYYSFEREHVGLRRLAGYGVTVTRGAASCMMWTYSCLLITMSRNTITFLRETFLHRFIPFDSFHLFHKLIALEALFFTVMHVIGHGINLYHISTWASSDLNCVFREYFRATNVLASFHYWAWQTLTGLTGIILTLIVIVMYVFAMPYARRNLFGAFWLTHGLYIFLYIFMIMHGTGRLVQAPLTQNFLIGPLVIYVIDKLISFSRHKVEINVKKADLLPSDVLGFTFKRPQNFEYKSGQWVRIACLELGNNEYHPFTLTSAPHEEHLSLHIRAVGPWTMNLRKTYDANNRDGKPFPNIYLDGPFGEGHQDWYRYKVAVLVGGGIGVTPFASILKDIVFRSKTAAVKFPCEKVYFLWVTRTQKQFEWLTDIIREVEENDPKRLVNVHIFITQFQQKFDLRTTMLYICERHFQKVCGKSLFTGLRATTHFGRPQFEEYFKSLHEEHPTYICERHFQKVCGKSLFTGLRATTHFGRPQFEEFFKSLHYEHPKVNQVGVFSCGPPPMTLNVDRACAAMNKYDNFPSYLHHYENF